MSQTHRAEHVGSLLRPAELLESRSAHCDGRLSLEQLRSVEDRTIIDLLNRQRDLGLGIFSDGEVRRSSWLSDMCEAVDGFVPQKVMLEWKGPGSAREGSQAFVAGAKLQKVRKLTAHETPFLRSIAPGPFKITLPAPSNFMVASYQKGISDAAYPTHEELLADLVEIIRDEIEWLIAQGASYIQLDAPFYSYYLDSQQRERFRQAGNDPGRSLAAAIAADNSVLNGIRRDDVTFGLHICRGNNRSRWFMEGGYDEIAESVFAGLDVDTFLLEYDTERSGGFAPLQLVPRGKTVVLGLVTTKSSVLESQEYLMGRIDEASRYLALENLALSPQCGFASVAAGNLISSDIQWRKLALVVETAERVWGQV